VKISNKIKETTQKANMIIERKFLFLKHREMCFAGKLCHADTMSIAPTECKDIRWKIPGANKIKTTDTAIIIKAESFP
jgi:hypothetical protein